MQKLPNNLSRLSVLCTNTAVVSLPACNQRVARGKNVVPDDLKHDKSVPAPTCLEHLSLSVLNDQSVGEISPK